MALPILPRVMRRYGARGSSSCLGSLRAMATFDPVPVKPRLAYLGGPPMENTGAGAPPVLTDSTPAWSNKPDFVPKKRGSYNNYVRFNRGDPLCSTHDGRRLVWGGDKSRPRGVQTAFSAHALRASCPCPSCLDPQTGTRLVPLLDRIPAQLRFADAVRTEDDGIKILWEGDLPEHMNERYITYSGEYLRKLSMGTQLPITDAEGHRVALSINWKGDRIARLLPRIRVDYRDWVAGDAGVLQYGLRIIQTMGILFLVNVPDDPESVNRIARRIGPQMDTIYGTTWESAHKRVATNIAETAHEMLLHQDLVYMAEPPRLKILHCVRNSCFGGESFFSDTMCQTVKLSLALGTEQLTSLATFPAVYEHVHDGRLYRQVRPILSLCPDTVRHSHVWWSPQFRAAPGSWQSWEPDTAGKWYTAQHAYNRLINSPRHRIEYRFGEGEAVILDNRRVLSGRRAYDPFTGERLFRGTYIADHVVNEAYKAVPEETADARTGIVLTGSYPGMYPPPMAESEPEEAPEEADEVDEQQMVSGVSPEPQDQSEQAEPKPKPQSLWRKLFQT